MSEKILDQLYQVLQARKDAGGDESYVASLYQKGAVKIAAKITEEAQELNIEGIALEGAPDDAALRDNLRSESADLLFHVMVMLAHHDMHPDEVMGVLEQRFGISGYDEKASRS